MHLTIQRLCRDLLQLVFLQGTSADIKTRRDLQSKDGIGGGLFLSNVKSRVKNGSLNVQLKGIVNWCYIVIHPGSLRDDTLPHCSKCRKEFRHMDLSKAMLCSIPGYQDIYYLLTFGRSFNAGNHSQVILKKSILIICILAASWLFGVRSIVGIDIILDASTLYNW